MRSISRNCFVAACISAAWMTTLAAAEEPKAKEDRRLTLVVMDPLAAPLSCPCVQGYAQRQYEKLAAHIESELGRPVQLLFAEALQKVDKQELGGESIDLIIGKDSVVRFDCEQAKIDATAVARLTDKTGSTTQFGMIVVPKDDPAQKPDDLQGYKIIFGPSEAEEKHAAALDLLKSARIEPPAELAISEACSDGACEILELPEGKSAAVISSYAAPLLEGCGTIKKGDLRVVGKTKPVPFVTAFVTDAVEPEDRKAIRAALLSVGAKPELCAALESLIGFVAVTPDEASTSAVSPDADSPEVEAPAWSGWRGPNRDGRYPVLPASLPAEPSVVWKVNLPSAGLGGIAADGELVVMGDRDLTGFQDAFRCYDADTGSLLWKVEYLAIGKLDYGPSPRATPWIEGDRALLLGAFGDLHCVALEDGSTIWKRNLRSDFKAKAEMPWGYCGSPLVVDGKVIVQAGGPEASLVALNLSDGSVAWKSPGDAPSYGSLIAGEFGGVRQIVGHDVSTLGGWDVRTGTRLWTLKPPVEGDFNVPTPVAVGSNLLVVTEGNGARLYRFASDGTIDPEPVARNRKLALDMSSPVVTAGKVFAVNRFLFCLDADDLSEIYRQRDPALGDYAAIIADDERLLIVGKGELLLADARSEEFSLHSRMRFDEPIETFSHPALVDDRLYLRGESALYCFGWN